MIRVVFEVESEEHALALAREAMSEGVACRIERQEQRVPGRFAPPNGHAPILHRAPPQPPGASLGPNGKWLGADGSELIVQPGPIPENRLPPMGALSAIPTHCRTHKTPLDQYGNCQWCQTASFEQVQAWPRNPPAQPTPGAEEM